MKATDEKAYHYAKVVWVPPSWKKGPRPLPAAEVRLEPAAEPQAARPGRAVLAL